MANNSYDNNMPVDSTNTAIILLVHTTFAIYVLIFLLSYLFYVCWLHLPPKCTSWSDCRNNEQTNWQIARQTKRPNNWTNPTQPNHSSIQKLPTQKFIMSNNNNKNSSSRSSSTVMPNNVCLKLSKNKTNEKRNIKII